MQVLWMQIDQNHKGLLLQTSYTPQEMLSKLTVELYLSQLLAEQGNADPDRVNAM